METPILKLIDVRFGIKAKYVISKIIFTLIIYHLLPIIKNESKDVNVIYKNDLIRDSMESYIEFLYHYITYKILSAHYLQKLLIELFIK